jgi:hypothetical protein
MITAHTKFVPLSYMGFATPAFLIPGMIDIIPSLFIKQEIYISISTNHSLKRSQRPAGCLHCINFESDSSDRIIFQ